MRRLSVVGSTGSGKTTFARSLASILGVPHIELDALNWGANWTMVDEALFRGRGARQIVWPRADAVIWLDPALSVILARLWRLDRAVARPADAERWLEAQRRLAAPRIWV